MEISEIAASLAMVGGLLSVAAFFNKKIKDSSTETKAYLKVSIEAAEKIRVADSSSIGRTLDTLKEAIVMINADLAIHSHKISQSDVVMVHLDDTLKSLGNSMTKLDETLNALQVVVARIDAKG